MKQLITVLILSLLIASCSSKPTTNWEQEYETLSIQHDSLMHLSKKLKATCELNALWKKRYEVLSIELDSSYWIKENAILEEYSDKMLNLAMDTADDFVQLTLKYGNLYNEYEDIYDANCNQPQREKLQY